MTRQGISWDESRWPLVLLTGQPLITDEDVDEYLTHLRLLLLRRQPFALVLDARRAGPLSIRACERSARWIGHHKRTLRQYCVAMSGTLPRPCWRFALAMVFAIHSPPFPYAVCDSLAEAEDWAALQLRRRHVASIVPMGARPRSWFDSSCAGCGPCAGPCPAATGDAAQGDSAPGGSGGDAPLRLPAAGG